MILDVRCLLIVMAIWHWPFVPSAKARCLQSRTTGMAGQD